jgi:hypothetical protein
MLRQFLIAVALGALFGVLAIAAWVAHCISRANKVPAASIITLLDGSPGVDGFATISENPYATSVEIQLWAGTAPNPTFKTLTFRSPEVLYSMSFPEPPAVQFVGEPPPGWERGLSAPLDTDQPAWKETVYGRPFPCFRVRGYVLGSPLAGIQASWGGVPGWSIAWPEAIRGILKLGWPATVMIFVLMLLTGPVRRGWRRRKGRCPSCGYDLRGIAAECPECGLSEPEAQARGMPRR